MTYAVESANDLRRTHMCGVLTEADTDREVVLMGWVQKRRDHGGLIFVDLRDRWGVVQVVFSPEYSQEALNKADRIRSEYVIAVVGRVQKRPEGTENPNLATGAIEIHVAQARILNAAKTPPFYIEDGVEVDENIRLRYRYLDLRRPEMQRALELRHKAAKTTRDFLDGRGFIEVETPMLTKSTPEGARDYLVPSRVNPGSFYALPQSPQLFKQILMVSGIDRYFQIVRCFRDEDLRADRQPEFTQIDMEMSFVTAEDVMEVTESMIAEICRQATGLEVKVPFPRLTYQEALDRFGTDKPDLRFGLELVDIIDVAAGCGFKVFRSAVQAGGLVKGILAPGCGGYSRKEIDELTQFALTYKAKGLAYFIVTEDGLKAPIAKFFSEDELVAIRTRFGARPGDLILFVADQPTVVYATLGALRRLLGERLDLTKDAGYRFTWVVDFPLLEFNDEEGRFVAVHHPFTAPREEDILLLASEPGRVRAQAYDLVLNGVELGGGSIRIHRRDLQEKVFEVIGLTPDEALEKFGFLLEAFDYGTPPHGGIAFGFDRLVMLLAGRGTIRDVMAFPKTQSASDLMTDAPDKVSRRQLRELHIGLDIQKVDK
ncbi:MAG: aspartate--tRNA ligase [Clostridia bacterium]|nr:aspartate--tRNA ligase [Clostridia bacterium]